VVSWDGYHEINGDSMVIYPLVNSLPLKNAMEIVDLAIKDGDFP